MPAWNEDLYQYLLVYIDVFVYTTDSFLQLLIPRVKGKKNVPSSLFVRKKGETEGGIWDFCDADIP